MSKKSVSKQRSKTSKSKSFLMEEPEVFYRMTVYDREGVHSNGWNGALAGYCFDISNKGNVNVSIYNGNVGHGQSTYIHLVESVTFKDRNAIVLIPLLQNLTKSGLVPLTHLSPITLSNYQTNLLRHGCINFQNSRESWEGLVNYFKDLKDKKVSLSIKKDSSKKFIEEIQLVNQQLKNCKEEIEYLKGKLLMDTQDYKEDILLLKQQLKNK